MMHRSTANIWGAHICTFLLFCLYSNTFSELEISFEESTVMVVEGMTAIVTLTIDSGILVGNLTFNVTDGTASTSNYITQPKFKCT